MTRDTIQRFSLAVAALTLIGCASPSVDPAPGHAQPLEAGAVAPDGGASGLLRLPAAPEGGSTRQIPRSIHSNGPPGFVRNRYLDESATNPTFTPLTAPARPKAPGAGPKPFLEEGSFPGSILIPGTTTSIGLSGFVRMDLLYDLDPVGDDRQFDTSSIPVPQGSGRNTNLDFSYSRFTIPTHTATDGFGDIFTFFQMDFFGADDAARVRFAYVDIGVFRFGKAVSVFADYDMWPNLIDPDGPNSTVLTRQTLIQVTVPITARAKVAVALEDPDNSLTLPTDAMGQPIGEARTELPDLAAHARYDTGVGHAQVAGLLRQLTYQAPGGGDQNALGYAVNLSMDVHPWAVMHGTTAAVADPTPLQKSRFLAQWIGGEGYSSYLESVAPGLDGALDAAGNLKALPLMAWQVGYEQWWASQWTSTFSYGEYTVTGTDAMPGASQKGSRYFAVNLMWVPSSKLWMGLEFLHGRREDLDGQSADADRVMFGVQFNF